MMRQDKPEHIGRTLSDLLAKISPAAAKGLTRDEIFFVWQKAAGQKAIKHSQPAQLKNKTLLINVDSTAWMYELRVKEQDIIKKINRLLKTAQVEKIKFRSAEIKDEKN